MKTIILILLSFVTTFLIAQTSEYGDTLFIETITFEQNYPFLELDTSNQNIWQIGEPGKVFFDTAYSKKNAIVTDTINPYPTNNSSHFDLLVGAFNYNGLYPWNIFVGVKHKYDTDTLKDGGYISVSYDNGNTWMNIINDTVYDPSVGIEFENENLYQHSDTLYNGEPGFSGFSQEWQTTWFAWHEIKIKSNELIGDTMIIRFNFLSDSIEDNREGWMIDNIDLYAIDLGGSVQENENSLLFSVYPNPVNSLFRISLPGHNSNLKFELINSQGQIVTQKRYVNIDSFEYDVSGLQRDIYLIRISNDKGLTGVKRLIVK
ncbi:MAG: T9SS type A sorting domain-containing protein [Chlorobi bacterium]|nr:T9SS type A sorting domain-containing protein [Chlorobiota bacterium]